MGSTFRGRIRDKLGGNVKSPGRCFFILKHRKEKASVLAREGGRRGRKGAQAWRP